MPLIDRIKSGHCPIGKFDQPPLRRVAPGDLVKIILDRIGYQATDDCGCAAMQIKMNAWGWIACVRREPAGHRQELVEWFAAKAREAGIQINREHLGELLMAGIKDLARKALRRVG